MDAYYWSKHPVVLAETKEGKIIVGNYTLSKKVINDLFMKLFRQLNKLLICLVWRIKAFILIHYKCVNFYIR
jgi:hypothetical protein